MIKILSVAMMVGSMFMVNCGKSGGSSGGGATEAVLESQSQNSSTSYLFNTMADLPKCEGSMLNALAFINSEKKFYNCSSSGWVAVDLGGEVNNLVKVEDIAAGSACAAGGKAITTGLDSNENGNLDADEVQSTDNICSGIDGFKIASTYYAQGDGANLCDLYSSIETCFLEVGAVDVFANGNWQVRLMFRHTYYYDNTTDGDTDWDTYNLDATFIIPNGDSQGAIKRLDHFVARADGSGFYLWAVIPKGKNKVLVVHDTNNNDLVDATDLVIAEYPLVKQ